MLSILEAWVFLVLSLPSPADDDYLLDDGKRKARIDALHILDTGGKIYIRASAIQKELKIFCRQSVDGKRVGVVRDGVGGALELGNGKPAIFTSNDLYLSIDALKETLNVRIVKEKGKNVIDAKGKNKPEPPAPKTTALAPGDRMINLSLPAIGADKPFEIASTKKRTMLVLWASWDWSRAKLSEWEALQKKFKGTDNNLIVVAAALDIAGPAKVEECAKDLSIPVVVDAQHRLTMLFDPKELPQWVYIDECGFIRDMSDMKNQNLPDEDFLKKVVKEKQDEKAVGAAWITDAAQDDLAKSRELYAKKDYAGAAAAAKGDTREAVLHRAAALLRIAGKEKEGLEVLKTYLKAKDTDTHVRRQKWALEFPAKMYAAKIDEKWLKDQEELEKKGG